MFIAMRACLPGSKHHSASWDSVPNKYAWVCKDTVTLSNVFFPPLTYFVVIASWSIECFVYVCTVLKHCFPCIPPFFRTIGSALQREWKPHLSSAVWFGRLKSTIFSYSSTEVPLPTHLPSRLPAFSCLQRYGHSLGNKHH